MQIKEEKLGGEPIALPDALLEKIRSELVPDAGAVIARFHKINIYEDGGFFAEHKDTPRSETHFGSLVVLLPVTFEGGALSIDHLGDRKEFDWARSSDFSPRHYMYSADGKERLAKHTPSNTARSAWPSTRRPTRCAGPPSSATPRTASTRSAPARASPSRTSSTATARPTPAPTRC